MRELCDLSTFNSIGWNFLLEWLLMRHDLSCARK
jgi:hypothetical protein